MMTYPIPSAKYGELVCTAGVTESGDFVRLYPIRYRDLSLAQQYKKYQWIEVEVERHRSDSRKESYRPNGDSLEVIGEPIAVVRGDWSERGQYVLARKSRSIEDLREKQKQDGTSLGVIRPRTIKEVKSVSDEPEWKPAFVHSATAPRLFDDNPVTRTPPRKVPYKFKFQFKCDDSCCTGHAMLNEDWELGSLYWSLVDNGATGKQAAHTVRTRFLTQIRRPVHDTHFFVGTVSNHPASWVIIGVFPGLEENFPATELVG